MNDFRHILVPHDFSDHAHAALQIGVGLAKRLRAEVTLVHIVQPPSYAYGYPAPGGTAAALPNLLELEQSARQGLVDLIEGLAEPPFRAKAEVYQGDNISQALCEAARKLDVDLIVMGTHGRTGLAHAFIGSVAERTLRSAPCPVLTVRGAESSS
ncbi:MAG: universal stress protein [Myxococcales bacterium]|nr:universal stress protein [Myxococcales bacterium]